MQVDTFAKIFVRDLAKLKTEIVAYSSEEDLWKIADGISNSAGNLCLHLVGNLNTYIGAELGHSGYVRNRDLEFSLKDIPREELLRKIDATVEMIEATFLQLDNAILDQEYPLLVYKEKTSTGYLLLSLAAHLGYHLGQINYHRCLVSARS